MGTKRLYGRNGEVLPYNQIVALVLSEGMYGGIREKSIEYFQKVYRLFSNRIGATLRYLPSTAQFQWMNGAGGGVRRGGGMR